MRYKIVLLFDRFFYGRYCWAECVSWVHSKSNNPFSIEKSEGCRAESLEHPSGACYCGRFYKGQLNGGIQDSED